MLTLYFAVSPINNGTWDKAGSAPFLHGYRLMSHVAVGIKYGLRTQLLKVLRHKQMSYEILEKSHYGASLYL